MKSYNINLKENELLLLMSILEDAQDDRASMTCNDPYSNEEELFSQEERIEMKKIVNVDEPEEEIDGFLFNMQYVEYLIGRIKEQVDERV
jgi:hypothetical protein